MRFAAFADGDRGAGDLSGGLHDDRRIRGKTISPFIQFNAGFDLSRTRRTSSRASATSTPVVILALVPIPNGTRWTGANEFAIGFAAERSFTAFKGEYQNWLPAIDIDIETIET